MTRHSTRAEALAHATGIEGLDYIITEVCECTTPLGERLPHEFILETAAEVKARVKASG